MRELKFRAWGKDNKRFIYIELKPNAQVQDDEWRYNNYADWEQYTGFKDKNGKEIYEGDIVKVARSYGYGFLPKGAKAKIEFDEKELCYKLRGQGEFRLTTKKELEVIGNIHQNPELMKEEE